MPEFVNAPNFYQNSDILDKIDLPKEDQSSQIQKTLQETKRMQKTVSNIEDSEEKRRKREQKTHQKEK
ncbi:hypothetical protein [Enterococcus mundtii]|uniref:hypothetical protein n=1 Tax=Enterococcus mundtii TaxID=53346 RepID=UPI0013765A93|nr:hypothetical protein [Enterococcus mundtii]NBA63569.1 hypothetical protein [Enterococcus mundtii]